MQDQNLNSWLELNVNPFNVDLCWRSFIQDKKSVLIGSRLQIFCQDIRFCQGPGFYESAEIRVYLDWKYVLAVYLLIFFAWGREETSH